MEVINDTNLNKFNNNHKRGVWLVWFFADWCGHCHSMAPEWKRLIDNNRHNVNLAKVRDDYQSKIDMDAPVQGYPTIVLAKNGQVSKVFSGDRTAESLNSFVSENTNAQELQNNSGIDSQYNNNSTSSKKKKSVKRNKTKRKKTSQKKARSMNNSGLNDSGNNTANNTGKKMKRRRKSRKRTNKKQQK